MVIRFLSKIEKWKNFSNLAPFPIEMEDSVWKSAEHYYQFKKFEKSDPSFANKIKTIDSPKEVKKLTLENNNFPAEWNDKKVQILLDAVRKKFYSYKELQDLLLATNDEELIEANPDDYFWGEGADGSGKNIMGKLLMQVREELRNKN